MAIDPEEFFADRQGAAVFKHGILKRYLAVFTSKVGFTAEDHKVCFLDAYAGPGEYERGEQGSPAIAKATAEFLEENRNLVGIYVERNKENLTRLEAFLADSKHEHHILAGDIGTRMPDVVRLIGNSPLLAFFDPFGLPVPMDQITAFLKRPPRPGTAFPPPTDLIIHVSYTAIQRLCGFITNEAPADTKTGKQRESIVKNCNEKLGGDWWQQIAIEREKLKGRGVDWRVAIAHGYAKHIGEVTGAGWFRVPVRDTPNSPVSYELLLVSRYTQQAHWVFHESVSKAHEDWREFNALKAQHQGGQQMLPIEPVDEDKWIAAIKANVFELLKTGEFVPRHKLEEVFGKTFGLARGTHLRTAIKELYKEGVTSWDGKRNKQTSTDLPDLVVTRGPKAPPLEPVKLPF